MHRDQVNSEEGPGHAMQCPFYPEDFFSSHRAHPLPPPLCWPPWSPWSALPATCPPPALCSHLYLIFPTLCPTLYLLLLVYWLSPGPQTHWGAAFGTREDPARK